MTAAPEPPIAGEPAEVRASAIHGQGLFATRNFAAGEVILVRDESRVVDAAHPLAPGDEVRATFDRVGSVTLRVRSEV